MNCESSTVELQAELDADGVVVNPPRGPSGSPEMAGVFGPEDSRFLYRRIEQVGFDVALTASEERSGKGGGGLKVAAFGLGVEAGGEAAKRASEERVSRVAFSIGIALPPSKAEGANRKLAAEQDAEMRTVGGIGPADTVAGW